MNPRRIVIVVLGALVVLGAIAFRAAAELTVKGDAAAWREVTAAYDKLSALAGYKMKTAIPGGQTMVIEIAPAGNALHMTMQGGNGAMEIIRVGDQSRYRMTAPGAPAGWMCQGLPPFPKADDPRALQGSVDIARGPDAAIDGRPMRVYVYTLETSVGGLSGSFKTTLYVAAGTGLPRRSAVDGPTGEQTIDFYDYGVPNEITLPPCAGA